MMEVHDNKCRSCLHTEIDNFSLKRSSVWGISTEIQVTYFLIYSLRLTFLSSVLQYDRSIAPAFVCMQTDRQTHTPSRTPLIE